jgi:hypothetical membrane protein
MSRFSRFHWFGLAAVIIIIFVTLIAALFFKTPSGARFSLIRHYLSELGYEGHSSLAKVFNAGLIIGGLLLIPFYIGLGYALPSIWAKIGMAFALIAAACCSLVGAFPLKHLVPHIIVADGFFRAGMFSTLFFVIAILAQPKGSIRIPKSTTLLSIPAAISYIAFNITMIIQAGTLFPANLSPALILKSLTEPPPFQLLATLQWGVYHSTILWSLGMAFSYSAYRKKTASAL